MSTIFWLASVVISSQLFADAVVTRGGTTLFQKVNATKKRQAVEKLVNRVVWTQDVDKRIAPQSDAHLFYYFLSCVKQFVWTQTIQRAFCALFRFKPAIQESCNFYP